MKTEFRAWDKISRHMFYPGEAKYCLTMVGSICDDETDSGGILENRSYRTKAMFFTGQHDKDGKKIYDGDIVIVDNIIISGSLFDYEEDYKKAVAAYQGKKAIVKYDNGGFGVHYIDGYMNTLYGSEKRVVVIGNIWENLELLKVK